MSLTRLKICRGCSYPEHAVHLSVPIRETLWSARDEESLKLSASNRQARVLVSGGVQHGAPHPASANDRNDAHHEERHTARDHARYDPSGDLLRRSARLFETIASEDAQRRRQASHTSYGKQKTARESKATSSPRLAGRAELAELEVDPPHIRLDHVELRCHLDRIVL